MFKVSQPLSMLIPVEETRAAERALVQVGGAALWTAVKANTPVAHGWEMGGLSVEEVASIRGGRKPGTLRASIFMDPPLKIPLGWMVRVATDDPIGPYVEWDTRPHMIYPRRASMLKWFGVQGGALTGPFFALQVDHPGTHGQHMFSIGALITEARFGELSLPVMEAWSARDLVALEEILTQTEVEALASEAAASEALAGVA